MKLYTGEGFDFVNQLIMKNVTYLHDVNPNCYFTFLVTFDHQVKLNHLYYVLP